MSDLIDRQDAIDAIHKEFDEICVWDESGQATANEVENILYEVPSAEPERKWIPVSEALPKEKGEYLVSYHPCHWNTVSEKVVVGMDTFRGKTTWAKMKYQNVIAWMPLPEPWKGEEK